MKLAYMSWGYSHDTPIVNELENAGIDVDILTLPEGLEQAVSGLYDIIFSVNFIGNISDVCSQAGIPYCSWVLELPDYDLYTQSVFNQCNYIGICDSYLYEKLWKMGAKKTFFLPDAVELRRSERVALERGICFMAKHPKQTLNKDGMTLYGKGYLDAFIHSQRVLYGEYILENGIINRVQQEFMECNNVAERIMPEFKKLYMADRYLAPACTGLQQDILLQNYENMATIYSDGEFKACKAEKNPYIEDESERGKIFVEKEFTLVLAPHTLHNAIPREALEVIMAGGFPICGFQKDYSYFFKNDENIACFKSSEELQNVIVKYGNSYEERERVRSAAYEVVAQGHTYKQRIVTMLDMWGKL